MSIRARRRATSSAQPERRQVQRARYVLVAAGVWSLAACETTSSVQLGPGRAPLLDDVGIAQPTDDVPAELAAFVGVWDGRWETRLDSSLAVQRVTAEGEATVTYAWGDSRGNFDAGRVRRAGQIKDGTLYLDRFGNGARARFHMRDNGMLRATYVDGARSWKGNFRRRVAP